MSKMYSKCAIVIGLFMLLSVFSTPAFAQDEPMRLDDAAVISSGNVAGDFAPDGWKVEAEVSGDLNGDGVSDRAITLIEDKPETDKDGASVDRSRGLVIVFGKKGEGFLKAAVVGRLLQCPNCGGAFYGAGNAPANVSIAKGVLIVQQDRGSRWVVDTTYRFRYDEQPSKFILIGFDYSSRDRGEGTSVSESTNYITSKRITTLSKAKPKTTTIAKASFSIEEVDSEQFDSEATSRLGLD